MILYDNKSRLKILCQRSGSVVFSPKVIATGLLSTLMCAVVFLIPDLKSNALIPSTVIDIYASVLGFVIVFRTNMAFNRYFEGVDQVACMFSKWRDAYTVVCCFIESSIRQFHARGDYDKMEVLLLTKARLLHWFTLLSAISVQSLQAGESDSDGHSHLDGIVVQPAPDNRSGCDDTMPLPSLQATASPDRDLSRLPSEAVESFASGMTERAFSLSQQLREAQQHLSTKPQVFGMVTEEEKRQLYNAHDVVLTTVKWILAEISNLHISKTIIHEGPFLGRVFQEISNGMLHFFMAMKISMVPFPFPFAQLLQYALFAFFMFLPFVALDDINKGKTNLPDIQQMLLALLVNFFSSAGFMALNEIAIELEDPFGDDANDYPVHVQQWNLAWAIEDGYFQDLPSDFDLQDLTGEVKAQYEKEVHIAQTKAAPPPAVPSGSKLSPEVADMLDKFDSIRESLQKAIVSLKASDAQKQGDMLMLDQHLSSAAAVLGRRVPQGNSVH